MTDFLELHPIESLSSLAELLSIEDGLDRGDVAEIQLEQVWREEAIASGDGAIEWFARSSLLRLLRAEFPDGWPAVWDNDTAFTEGLAYASWLEAVGPERSARAKACWRGLDPPPGWSPSTVDDPVLASTFALYWR